MYVIMKKRVVKFFSEVGKLSNEDRSYLLTGTVCRDGRLIKGQYILIRDGKIVTMGPADQAPTSFSGEKYSFPEQFTIVPGYIDVHIHGANGADAMDATTEALETMARTLPQEGTTAFFPTTMTQAKEKIAAALENAATFMEHHNARGQAEVTGIHLEGPFINPARKGAQPEEYVIQPDPQLFDEWQKLANGNIRLVTVAPERENGFTFVRHITEQGVIASIGHSDADFTEVKEAVAAGANHVTHLYNGMKGLHHREPGTAGGALLLDELYVEIIADGFHIHPEMIRLAIRTKGLERVILVTDSMRAKWLPDGKSELGGQEVFVKDGKATLANGSLAGSILKMKDAVKNVMAFAGLSLPEAVKLATENPARHLGIFDRKGSLDAGKDADIVILNEQYDPVITFCRGTIAYKGENVTSESHSR